MAEYVQRSSLGRLTYRGAPWELRCGSTYGNLDTSTKRANLVTWALAAGLSAIRITDWLDTAGTIGTAEFDATRWGYVDDMVTRCAGAGLKVVLDISCFRNLLQQPGHNPYGIGSDICTANHGADAWSSHWVPFLTWLAARPSRAGWTYVSDPVIALVDIAGEPPAPPPSAPAAWSSVTAYSVGNWVQGGTGATTGYYHCVLAHTNHTPPNATYWALDQWPAPTGADLTAFYVRARSWLRQHTPFLISSGGLIGLSCECNGVANGANGIDWPTIFTSMDVANLHFGVNAASAPTPGDENNLVATIGPWCATRYITLLVEEFSYDQNDFTDANRAAALTNRIGVIRAAGVAGWGVWNLGPGVSSVGGGSNDDISPNTPLTFAALTSSGAAFIFVAPGGGGSTPSSAVGMTRWRLWINDGNQRTALVERYAGASLTVRYCAAGVWQVTGVPTQTAYGAALATPGSRIEFERLLPYRDPVVVMTGPVLGYDRKVSNDGDTLDVEGIDDTAQLGDRLVHPQPASAATGPPYTAQDHDVHPSSGVPGPASSVLSYYVSINAGDVAAFVGRQIPGLTVGPDPNIGDPVLGRGRWQNLLEFCGALAGVGKVGFRVVDLVFEVFQPSPRPRVTFTPTLANVESWEVKVRSAGANYVYIGAGSISGSGSGEGTDRIIYEGQVDNSVSQWGRIETFDDHGDINSAADLTQALSGTLSKLTNEIPTVTVTTIDRLGSHWGYDYDLGDTVTVDLDGLTLTQPVVEVTAELSAEGEKIKPTIGPPSPIPAFQMFQQLATLRRRVRDLERR